MLTYATQSAADRALAKSDEQARVGNLPRLLRVAEGVEVWSVHSRTGGEVYLVERGVSALTGEVTMQCDCPALACWHLCHVERACEGYIGRFTTSERKEMRIDPAELSGRRRA